MNVLDTIIAKLDRANEHLKAFNSAVREFQESRPYTFTNKFEPKGNGIYDWIFTIHVNRELPLSINAIFGDGIQNVRATLDYLAYQLAVTHVGVNGDLDGVEFPIFERQSSYMAVSKKGKPNKGSGLYKVRSIHPDAQAIIESLQPYHGGDAVMLWQIHQLSIIDKHRHFHIVSPPLGQWVAGIPLGDGLSPEPLRGLTIISGSLKHSFIDGAEVARFEVSIAPNFNFKVRVKHTIPGDVILDEIQFANSQAGFILAGLIGYVRKKVISQLSPFLK